MRDYKTEAIILSTVDIFDADRSFLLFTRAMGKVRARAKGVRKPTSKLTGHLLTYLPTKIELAEATSGFIITGAQVIGRGQGEAYPENSLLFQRQATVIAEVVNRLFTEQEPHPEIYDGLTYTIERLRAVCGEEGRSVKAPTIAAEFILKSVAELGYRPELMRCVVTGKEVTPDYIAWNSNLGGVLSEDGYRQVSGVKLESSTTLKALRLFLTPEFWAERLQMPAEVQQEVCRIIYDYVQTQVGQPLKSLLGGF